MNDPVLHADMLANLGRPGAQLVYAAPDGVVLRVSDWLHMVSCRDESFLDRLLPLLPDEPGSVILHQACLAAPLMHTGKYRDSRAFYQVCYDKTEPLPVRLPENTVLRALTRADLPVVCENYHSFDTDDGYIAERIDAGMLGAFVDGRLAGFMGTHDERSMGLLVILPEFRRHHLAEALECAFINRQLALGEVPYGQVLTDNEASLALQRKLNMRISETPVYWLF